MRPLHDQLPEGWCPLHGEVPGVVVTDDAPCPLPHTVAVCPVCSVAWAAPDAATTVFCVVAWHVIEAHPESPQAADIRTFSEEQTGSANPNDWCHHDPAAHRHVVVMEPAE